ncbi:uncharacterized protein LOC122537760 isoform X1 [Frieseomelitta varia]|uniref:uncharacterized protein LOC122537760 isoform X1 n=2 Tax=Frieseomelitta varia TaxID=561572 RepID=UPI001CB6972D|nr:uncharacterized protein LOC122537760 isoform X1 [Frieseomelitta varia]XP_043527190.1 uncharacterized protein LOC122537760 isoform X1 [Frieseomelitta varia]
MNYLLQDRLNSAQSDLEKDTKREKSGMLKLNNDESKRSITELFPWILEFRKMCRSIHTWKNMSSLTELMQFYVRNVSVSVNECYTKPSRASKLKDSISETLLLFLYIYRELSEDHDRFSYLNYMSDLLAFYIDMELKASRKSKEDHDKICGRITSCLYVYLEHSVEHLLDTLIKIQFMCRSYHHILDPIITKIIRDIPIHPESSIMYIRYFFIYRLWRKINENVAVKNQITAAAMVSLGPLPSTFSSSILEDVLPKVPKNQPNSTKTLLQHKFNIKKHCEMFAQYCRKSGESVYQDGTSIDSSSRINSNTPEDKVKKDIEYVDNNVNSIISDKNKQNESISLLNNFKILNLEGQTSFKCLDTFSNKISTKHIDSKIIKSNKNRLGRKCKKSNQIVIIDLTSDTVLEKCIKKGKSSKKLPWLEKAKKNIDSKIVKSSQKKKRQRNMENNSRNVRHRPEDSSQSVRETATTEDLSENHESDTCRTVVLNNDENKMDTNEELTTCTENIRKSIVTQVNTKEVNEKTSTVIDETLSSSVVNNNCLSNADILNMQSGEEVNNSFNKQTVIKHSIETDVFSKPAEDEKVESLKNVCDLETERPGVNNSTICTQYDSEDNAVSSNRSNFNVINDKETKKVLSPDDKCDDNVVQNSELQDNIDGLSLLASVSQHIPHLKPETDVKSEQIKVKDYASLRYTCYSQISDDEANTNDSSNTVSQLLENPSTEIINRIVGIYPEDTIDKLALRVEITSNEAENGNDTELCNVISHPETGINYDMDTLTHNLTPIENNMQTIKENTNVILNGETIVLLQKSPNSNLYIINKAVENSEDHNSDEDINLKEKNWIPPTEECGQFEAVASLDLVSRQNIKQEFNDIASNCAIPGFNAVEHPLHIPVSHPTTLPPIYGACAGNAELCVPYHKHCTSVTCNLQINATTSLHSYAKLNTPCKRSHCSCLNCSYDIATHCRQCSYPATDTHVSCIENSPYFLPTHSSVQSPAVHEHEKAKNILKNKSLEQLELQCDSEKDLFKKDTDNKLPLKKRLKARAMAYGEVSYPAVPMISIAALEVLDGTRKKSDQIVKSEESHDDYHYNSHLIPGKNRIHVYQESCLQRTVKTSAQEKEMDLSNVTSMKQFGIETMEQEGTYKRVKKSQSHLRQTRSSKRNVPKVNYSYTDVDPEWNPSRVSKRKRKKTSR